jgi:hypothetical protein
MSKNTKLDNSPQPSINPVLKTALSKLDLDLERELERYRRLRGEKRFISKEILAKKFFPNSPTPTKPVNLPLLEFEDKTDNSNSQLPKDKVISDDPDFDRESISLLVHQPFKANGKDLLTASDSDLPPPDDYLESSENLLRSLAEQEQTQKFQAKPSQKITPVGLAAIFLFSVTFALLSFVWISENVNPNYWDLSKFWLKKGQQATTEANNATNPPNPATVNNPNLANQEFVDLNLQNLSTIKSNSSTPVQPNTANSASPPPNPVASSEQAKTVIIEKGSPDLATALLPPSLLPQSSSSGVVSTPQTSASTSDRSTEFLPPASLNDKFYYVLADYTGDPSLQKARKIDKNAYLRQFPQGMRIQIGAFDKQIDADKLIERLKKQGMSAYVYRAGQ